MGRLAKYVGLAIIWLALTLITTTVFTFGLSPIGATAYTITAIAVITSIVFGIGYAILLWSCKDTVFEI